MKQRIYLHRANTSEYVYLAWFELTETQDLYWGCPRAGLDMESKVIETDGSTGLLTLSAPDDWERLPSAHHKHSYHQSGRRHTTAGGSGAAAIADSTHTPLGALIEPTLLCGVLTGIPAKYPRYQRDLNRHNSQAVILGMQDDNQWFDMRHYLEFYVTPSGQAVAFPPMLVNVSAQYHQRIPAYSSFSVEFDRILAIRHIQVPIDHRSNMVEFWIVPGASASLVINR